MSARLAKAYRILGHFYFLILFILAGVYYLERTIFLDSALQIFKWVQFSGFNIEAGRVSAIIPQIIPKILIWLGVPLKMVLFSTSLSFILVFYLAFLFSVYKLRSITAGLCIVLALTLCSLRTFYFSVVEVHQALVYPFLFFAWLQFSKDKTSIRFLSIAALLMILNFLTHPTTLMTVLFVLGYHVIQNEQIGKKWPYQLLGAALLFFSVRWVFFSVGGYESGLYSDAMNIGPAMQDVWNLPGIRFISDQVWKNNTLFLIPLLMFAWSIFAMLQQKKLLLSAFYVISIFAFILITAITYQRGDSAMMMEKNYLALGVFISMGFVTEVLLSKRMDQRIGFIIVVAVLLLKIRDIALTGAKMAKPRLAAIERIVTEAQMAEGQKFLIDVAEIPQQIKVDWALPIETLLFSSLDNGGNISVMTSAQFNTIGPNKSKDSLFIIPYLWQNGTSTDLNANYFSIGSGEYKELEINRGQ